MIQQTSDLIVVTDGSLFYAPDVTIENNTIGNEMMRIRNLSVVKTGTVSVRFNEITSNMFDLDTNCRFKSTDLTINNHALSENVIASYDSTLM